MINTEKVIGFYTDVFGNEIDEYEQDFKYTVHYKGAFFEGDTDGWNECGYDDWDMAFELYHAIGGKDVYISDNEYGCTFSKGEWY